MGASKKLDTKVWTEKKGVHWKVTSQADLSALSYLGRSRKRVTPQACNFISERFQVSFCAPRFNKPLKY